MFLKKLFCKHKKVELYHESQYRCGPWDVSWEEVWCRCSNCDKVFGKFTEKLERQLTDLGVVIDNSNITLKQYNDKHREVNVSLDSVCDCCGGSFNVGKENSISIKYSVCQSCYTKKAKVGVNNVCKIKSKKRDTTPKGKNRKNRKCAK